MFDPSFRRRRFLVDRRMQLSVVLSMVAAHFALTLVYVIGLVIASAEHIGPSSAEARNLGIAIAALYFTLVLFATIFVGVLVSHRIAGPARVIENAVRGLRADDFSRRITLRTGDHLQSLATEVQSLQTQLAREREELNAFLESLGDALAEGEIAAGVRLHQEFTADDHGAPADADETCEVAGPHEEETRA